MMRSGQRDERMEEKVKEMRDTITLTCSIPGFFRTGSGACPAAPSARSFEVRDPSEKYPQSNIQVAIKNGEDTPTNKGCRRTSREAHERDRNTNKMF